MTENKNIVDFSTVQEPVEKVSTAVKRVTKGAHVLTIIAIEDTMSKSGTPGFIVTLKDEEGTTFPHTFWNTEKTRGRLQNLVMGFTGVKPTGELDLSTLVGQSSNCVVDADVKINEKDGKTYRNLYPTLRYLNFANKTVPFKDEDARENEPTVTSTTTRSVLDVEQPDNDSGLPF